MCLAADELDAADNWATRNERSQDANSYFGMGLQPKRMPASERGSSDSVIAIPGAWCDIDFAESAGKKKSKKKYPPREVVEQCLASMPLQPSVVVLTGGGLHPYWLFHDVWEIESQEQRDSAASLIVGWQSLIGEHLSRLGDYALDSTFDLARVMRLPGSWNHRAGVRVSIGEGYGDHLAWRRYEPEDLRQFVGELSRPQKVYYEIGALVLSEDRSPLAGQLEALCENCPEFAQIFRHKGKKTYDSNSEREMALAAYAVQAGWTDQQIADLLIHHRRKWEPEKLEKLTDRQDYITRTISRARGDRERDAAIQTLGGNGEDDYRAPDTATASLAGENSANETEREKIIGLLSSVFGVRVQDWIQFGRETPIYTLILAGSIEIKIGGVNAVVECDRAFRQRIYAQTGYVMPGVPRARWKGVVEALAKIVTVHEAEDATDKATVMVGIDRYIRTVDFYAGDRRDLACIDCSPFTDDGWLYIHVESLVFRLNMRGGAKWEKSGLLDTMRKIGFKQKTVHFAQGDTRSTRSYWRCDMQVFGEAIAAASGGRR